MGLLKDFRHILILSIVSLSVAFYLLNRPTLTSHHLRHQNPPGYQQYQELPRPMVLALKFWEQTSNGLKNLFDLQCWASSVNISNVVEPSIYQDIHSGVFQFTTNYSNHLAFSHLFDLDNWNSMTQKKGFSPLVSTENFLQHATKDAIHVQVAYLKQFWIVCKPLINFLNTDWYVFLTNNGFRILRTVCVDLRSLQDHSITSKDFQKKIFGERSAGNVTVIFDFWLGIRNNSKVRIAMNDSECSAVLKPLMTAQLSYNKSSEEYDSPSPHGSPAIMPSKRISELAEEFISSYLHTRNYTVIMVRTEKLSSTLIVNSCVHKIGLDLARMRAERTISKIILFSDIGKHGSYNWNVNAHRYARNFIQRMHQELHINETMDGLNTVFEKITQSSDSVQVAWIQSVLAVRARCLILLGGGLYQLQILNSHGHFHKCYSFRDHACKSQYINKLHGVIT